MRPDRANFGETAPLHDLLTVLLRQFKRPLANQNVELSEDEIAALVQRIVERQPPDATGERVRAALIALVTESEAVLAKWNLTFQQSLDTGMDQMPGWESTAEFLDIANEKSNAELRISTGAPLVTALGDRRYAPYLLFLVGRADDEVDRAIAGRILRFVSQVDDVADWLEQVKAWLADQRRPPAS